MGSSDAQGLRILDNPLNGCVLTCLYQYLPNTPSGGWQGQSHGRNKIKTLFPLSASTCSQEESSAEAGDE